MVLRLLRKRKNIKAILWGLAIIIIPAFVLWGAGDAVRGRREANFAGTIFGERISIEKYLSSYNAVRNQAVMIYGSNLERIAPLLNLEQQAWDRLILLTKAEREKIKITDDEIVETISAYPFFRRDGRFDKQIYETILTHVFRTNPKDFEVQIRDSLKIQRLAEKVLSQVQVSNEEVKEAYKQENERVKVSYVLFKPTDFLEKVEISEERLKKFYEKNSYLFKKPPQVNIKYIPITYSEIKKNIIIQNDEIKQYYESNIDEFKIENVEGDEITDEFKSIEEVKDRIVEKLKRKQAEEEVDGLYIEIFDFISQNPSLEKIGEKFNLPVKESGFFSIQERIPGIGWSYRIARQAFELGAGVLSDFIDTPDGYYLIQVKAKKDSYIPEYDEIKLEVARKYKEHAANQLAEEKAKKMLEQIKDKMKDGIDFVNVCESLNLEVKSTQVFSRGDYIPMLGRPTEFINTSFGLEEGKISEKIVETIMGFAIIKLDKFIPIDEEEFEEKMDEYKNIVLSRKKQDVYIRWLNQLRDEAQLKSNLDRIRRVGR